MEKAEPLRRSPGECVPDNVGGLELTRILKHLSMKRPVFHSEADFQHALAWTIQQYHPDVDIRLEYRPPGFGRRYVDIWIKNDHRIVAMELKYWTRKLECDVEGEGFSLLNQGAQDIGRYDFLKDIRRLEEITERAPNSIGIALTLTNDCLFWKPPRSQGTVDAEFRIHEGRELSGMLAWADHTGQGTKRGREAPITLHDRYNIRWWDYSNIEEHKYGRFRGLMFKVGGTTN